MNNTWIYPLELYKKRSQFADKSIIWKNVFPHFWQAPLRSQQLPRVAATFRPRRERSLRQLRKLVGQEKGLTHASRAKKALPVNEGSLGGEKESRSEVIRPSNGHCTFSVLPLAEGRFGGRGLVLARGLEPPRVSPYGPEPYASANSATRA